MNIQITKTTKIKVSVGSNEIELTDQEARELQSRLNSMLGSITLYDPRDYYPQYPIWPRKFEITCDGTTSDI